MDLRNKVALVTGGASGYGKEYCKELFRQGCKVSICDIDADAGEELLHQLSKHSKDRVIFCSCDVTDYPQFEQAFQTTISKLGNVDIVVNNAAVMNDRLWELEVDVNLNGVIRGLLLAFRFLGKDRGGSGGVVINAGSSSNAHPFISLPIFTATKHAVAALTRSYGDPYHFNLTGIRVIAICPAPSEAVLAEDARRRLVSGEYVHAWQRDVAKTSAPTLEHLTKSFIEILQKAPSGSCWLVEDSHQPKEISLFR